MTPMPFLANPPRYLLFTGKGGVGKTSVACASAVALADRGLKVLIVSTDPASNLDAVLGVRLGSKPLQVPGAPGLLALNIDPEQAANDYRERTLAPYRGLLPETKLALMEEQLSGACTLEIAAFDEFTLLMGQDLAEDTFDHVIFDTAPTGHTLRLLQLPAAWTGFLKDTEGESCLGPFSGLKSQQARYAATVQALADPQQTLLVLVTRPERVALIEAARTSGELSTLHVDNQTLVVNGVFHAQDPSDPLAVAYEQRGQQALAQPPPELLRLAKVEVPLRGYNIVGLEAVRGLLVTQTVRAEPSFKAPTATDLSGVSVLADLLEDLGARDHGLVMVMGKGGVGKTTIAAAVAVGLADRGLKVHLTTTDPAQHLHETLTTEVPGLRVSYIDPVVEARRYREEALATKGQGLDEAQRVLLEEELRSPCYDEVAVFQAFSRIVSSAKRDVVVLDTAPTGHTLLLLDTTGAYHRQVEQSFAGSRVRYSTPLMLLQDPTHTKVLIVAVPETTPVQEAQALQDDLRRAKIEPYAWVINASLAAARPRDRVLAQRARAEYPQIRHVRDTLAQHVTLVPFQAEEPVGAKRLREVASRDTLSFGVQA